MVSIFNRRCIVITKEEYIYREKLLVIKEQFRQGLERYIGCHVSNSLVQVMTEELDDLCKAQLDLAKDYGTYYAHFMIEGIMNGDGPGQ